jgi:hypothetical protein
MCLLVHQPANVTLSDQFLQGVFSLNRDGLGVMYSQGGRLVVSKSLPQSAAEFIAFIREHADGRESIWHARMRTHGDINLDNCHPYSVTDDVALAHNGILSAGNAADPARSDTWHFVERVIRPAVLVEPSIVEDPKWQAYIGQLIGSSNKFGLFTSSGAAVIINRASGLTHEGAWLSNRYAWRDDSAYETVGYGSWGSRVWEGDRWQEYRPGRYRYVGDTEAAAATASTGATSSTAATPSTRGRQAGHKVYSARDLRRAALNSYRRGTLRLWVEDAPRKANAFLDALDAGADLDAEADPEAVVLALRQWFQSEGAREGSMGATL